MSESFQGYAAKSAGGRLELTTFNPAPLGADEVEIRVESCGLCHSDLSMINNDWGISAYPLIAGHEVVGVITKVGAAVTARQVGQRVGLGWYARSCLSCSQCLTGNHHLCRSAVGTIVGRPGGFADRVRAQWIWATPIPDNVDKATAGPLFCGGSTVFNPMLAFGVSPTDTVGVIAIGGLGHLALKFLRSWGCEVVAFTSSSSKRDEALRLGAHRVVNSTDSSEMASLRGQLDYVISTVNVELDWNAILETLAPRGRLHFVGALPQPVPLSIPQLIGSQYTVSASPVGSPTTTATLLNFAGRHQIAPQTEFFPMSQVNEALAHLKAGKARYRVVLNADFS